MSAQDKELLNEEIEKETMETPVAEITDETNDKQAEETKQNAEIEKLKAELDDWKQSYMRKQADFQNFTKRKEREMEELRKYAAEKIVTRLLDGIDNLERAINSAAQTKDFDGLVKGVEIILGNLKDIMKSEGVEEINTENVEFVGSNIVPSTDCTFSFKTRSISVVFSSNIFTFELVRVSMSIITGVSLWAIIFSL